jgi:hypothetical protein
MPVVISEFEVMAESAPEPRKGASEAAPEPAQAKPLDPCALATAVRVLELRALRNWAH